MAEPIYPEDLVSRHVDSPHKFSRAEQDLRAGLWEFKGGEESLIWRKKVADLATVHAMGCKRQLEKRLTKSEWTYEGALTAQVAAVTGIQIRVGHGFVLEHTPEEGEHHVSIRFRVADGVALEKSHKSELKASLLNAFHQFDRHDCEPGAATA